MTRLAQSIINEMETEKQPCLPFLDPIKILKGNRQKKETSDTVKISNLREEQRIIDGIGDVFGKLYRDLKLDRLISSTHKDGQWNNILESCVLARIANPVSKRRSASLLEADYGIKIPLEKIYRVMDHVADRESDIKQRIAQATLSLFQEQVDVLFFDVTTLYFESIELRTFGFSKDCKFKEVQVVLALVTTTQGLPITYKLFPGNTYEGGTLVEVVKDLQTQYAINNILLVADRAMFNEENLSQMERLGIQYIVAAKLKALPKSLKSEILHSEYNDQSTVIGDELHWLKEFEYKSRRLVVGNSSKRAEKDAADRQRLVDRLMKKVKGDKIKVKDLIPNYGSKKYISIENGSASINQKNIEADAEWDGLHGVITNATYKTPSELLSRYRELWQIEEAFRISKHDLRMRPIYHWTENRIKAHIAICFLAFTLAKQAVYRIALQQEPMSFEQIRNELLHAQSSVVIDLTSKKNYIIPSHVTVNQKKLYQAFGLKRSQVPYELT
jgi:transposase